MRTMGGKGKLKKRGRMTSNSRHAYHVWATLEEEDSQGNEL